MQKEEFSKSKVFFILNTENKPRLLIGRNALCDVRIGDDISVSRVHSSIKKIGDEYFIEDNESTFGTLIQVQYPIFLSAESFSSQPLVLQSGKTLMNINVQFSKKSTHSKCKQSCLSCLPCSKAKASKKTNRSLATFDKLNYFPVQFVDSNAHNKDVEPESKLSERVSFSQDKSKVIQKTIKGHTHNIVQAMDEEDPNQQQDEQYDEREVAGQGSGENSLAADLPAHLRHSLAGVQHGRHQSQSREMWLESMYNQPDLIPASIVRVPNEDSVEVPRVAHSTCARPTHARSRLQNSFGHLMHR